MILMGVLMGKPKMLKEDIQRTRVIVVSDRLYEAYQRKYDNVSKRLRTLMVRDLEGSL